MPDLIINSATGHPVAVEIIEGKLTEHKQRIKEVGLSFPFYCWMRRVALQMRTCKRKVAIGACGRVYLIDDSFEPRPFYPLSLDDMELSGLLGVDVMYVTRIQTERAEKEKEMLKFKGESNDNTLR